MEPPKAPLLRPQSDDIKGRLCVVLDMDETLVHSQFTRIDNDYRQAEDRPECANRPHDFAITIQNGDHAERVFVFKRPGLARFLQRCGEHFEPVVFTAALPVYANPVLDTIDERRSIRTRLYRDSTITFQEQNFVKDMSLLGRDMGRVVLVDNNPLAMLASVDNAMPILSYFDDDNDAELDRTFDMLMEMKNLPDVRPFLKEKYQFEQQLRELRAAQQQQQQIVQQQQASLQQNLTIAITANSLKAVSLDCKKSAPPTPSSSAPSALPPSLKSDLIDITSDDGGDDGAIIIDSVSDIIIDNADNSSTDSDTSERSTDTKDSDEVLLASVGFDDSCSDVNPTADEEDERANVLRRGSSLDDEESPVTV